MKLKQWLIAEICKRTGESAEACEKRLKRQANDLIYTHNPLRKLR